MWDFIAKEQQNNRNSSEIILYSNSIYTILTSLIKVLRTQNADTSQKSATAQIYTQKTQFI